ncbi:MAG: FAD-binding oxidoreductase [Pseudomonadota bacterium]
MIVAALGFLANDPSSIKEKHLQQNGSELRTVAIIGAGIVGVSTALWLQREGHKVILIDRAGPAEGASFGNGGVLASCAIVPVTVPGLLAKAPAMLLSPNQPLFLKWSYLPKLAPWLLRYLRHANEDAVNRRATAMMDIIGDSLADHQALAAGTAAERWITPCDYVYLYRSRADYESDAFGWAIRKAHGFKWDVLEGRSVRDYDSAFDPSFGCAAKLGNHGRITDPGQYVKDLASHVVANGGEFIKADVSDIVREEGAVTGVRTGGETITCDAAVVATGAWSGPLAKKLGITVPLESERGYHVELWEPNIMPRVPTMIAAGKFVATPMEGRLRLAGIVEYGGLKAQPSQAPFDFLMRSIKAAMPTLTWKEKTQWMGHRPAIADSMPLIGEVPDIKNAFVGFGHDHVGLTGGPKTGRILSQFISGRSPNIDLLPFAPGRF